MDYNADLNAMKDHLIYDTPVLRKSENLKEINDFSLLEELNHEILEYSMLIDYRMIESGMYILKSSSTLIYSHSGAYGRIEVYYVDMGKWEIGSDTIEEFINKKEIRKTWKN